MGMSRSWEMVEYRKIIMRKICTNKKLLKLLGEEDTPNPEDTIPYICCFPHEYIPDVITETERYINFEVTAVYDSNNKVYKDVTIYFFVFCHEDKVRYFENGREYLWYDLVVCELDNIFGDKNVMGVGNTIFISNNVYYPQKKFKGRLVKFTVKDFTNGLDYGKPIINKKCRDYG